MLAPILFLCLASSNISKGQFQKEAYHLFFHFHLQLCTAKFTVRCKALCTAQRILVAQRTDRICRAVDFVAQRMSVAHKGCCRAVDFVAQWILSCSRIFAQWICRAVDLSHIGFFAQWICHA
jgi:hypothetical protein